MKKITLFFTFLAFIFGYQSYAQYGCGDGVVITDGYTASGITSPGTAGPEDWNDNPTVECGGTSNFYWDDDVYLFEYTAGANDEEISMTTFSRKSWNGLGIFATCTGTALDDCLDTQGTTGGDSTKTVTAIISAGQTVYIAVGQWGSPNDLDFDVTAFSATPLVNPPSCTVLDSPADGATDVISPTLTWSTAPGGTTSYKLNIGTSSGATDVENGLDVGNVLTYDLTSLNPSTTYFVTVIASNANGDATGCTETSFTTAALPTCADNAVSTPDPSCGNFDVPLSWDAATNATGYVITVGTTPGGTDVFDNVDLGNVTSTTVTADDLTLDTTYYWTVTPYSAVGSATGCSENTFATVATGCYCTSETTSIDGNGIGNLQVGTTDFPSGGTLSYEDFTGAPVDLAAGISANVQITFETGYTYGVTIWIDFNDDYTFEASEMVYSGGESAADNPTTFDASFIMPPGATPGVHRMRIGSDDTNADSEDPCNSSSWHVTMDVDVNIVAASCSPAAATAVVSADCGNDQFFIDVDVTDLGDGTPEITDGVSTWSIAGTGITQVGPFASGDSVSLTVTHGTDSTCDLPLGNFNYTCPPSNDEPANAIDLSVDAGYCDGVNNNGDNTAATDSGEGAGSCFNGGASDDVWFTFTVPAGVATVDVSTDFTGGTNVDTEIAVYSGTPGAFTEIACSQDEGTTILSNGSSYNSLITDLAVNIGETYYVQVAGYGTTNQGTFCLEISTNQLGVNDFELSSFDYYPNPVNNKLSLRAQDVIQNVSVYNMLGQEVIRTSPNLASSDVDMSALQAGAYFVQVTVQDITETIRIIKK